MRKMFLIMMVAGGCVAASEGAAVQAVAGPGGVTVTARPDPSQLAVSWSADAAATQYRVLRSSGGAAFTFVASVSGAPPSTSYVDTGLSGGVSYCYALQSVYAGGAASDVGASACAPGSGGAAPATVRVSVPLFTPGTSSVFPGRFLSTSGALGAVVQLPPIPVGSTITRLDARVRDSATGPTTLILAIAEQADNSFVGGSGAPSPASSGTGAFQTLTLSGQARQVVALHTYYAGVFVNFVTPGTEPCLVSAIDVTYQPPAPL